MKTTVELPDDLLEEAKRVARAERITLRTLIVEGLRAALGARRKRVERFTLREASVSGRGVRPGVSEGDWEGIRDAIYRERGS